MHSLQGHQLWQVLQIFNAVLTWGSASCILRK